MARFHVPYRREAQIIHIIMITIQNEKAIPYDLILKSLKGEADAEERTKLGGWIKKNDRHGRLWSELQRSWDDISRLNAAFNPDKLHAWQQIVEKTQRRYQKPPRRITLFWRIAAAACFLALTGFGISFLFKTSTPQTITYTQYATQLNKSLVTLPDSTQVWLNANTTLKISTRFNQQERQVEVEGEALFDVVHNPDIPFIVDMKNVQVVVYGTKFNVQSSDDAPETTVTLLEGSVSMLADGHPGVSLHPGAMAVYNHINNEISVSPADTLATLWARHELRIEEKSLEETAHLLANWYRMSIEVAPSLKNKHFYTITVRHESASELLEVMQKIAKFNYKIEENRILIY